MAVVAVAVAGSIGYVYMSDSDSGTGGGGSSVSMDMVPSEADLVAEVDVESLVGDEDIKEWVNHSLGFMKSTDPNAPEDYQGMLETLENQMGLSPDKVNKLILYTKFSEIASGSTQYVGLMLKSDWSEEKFIGSLEEAQENMKKGSYEGVTVYRRPSTPLESGDNMKKFVAVLGDGNYLMGTDNSIEDAIAISEGEESGWSGGMKEQFDSMDDGVLKFASAIPSEYMPTQPQDMPFNIKPIQKIEYASGVFSKDGSDVNLELRFEMESESSCESLKSTIDLVISTVKPRLGIEEIKNELDKISWEKDGKTLIVKYETSVEGIKDLISGISEFSGQMQL